MLTTLEIVRIKLGQQQNIPLTTLGVLTTVTAHLSSSLVMLYYLNKLKKKRSFVLVINQKKLDLLFVVQK
jgi:hypothetical protein